MGQRRREMLNTELGLTAFTRRHTRPSLLLALLAAFLQMVIPAKFSLAQSGIAYEASIVGVSDNSLRRDLESISNIFKLRERPPATISLLQHRAENDTELFQKVLRAQGYYDASIDIQINQQVRPAVVTFKINMGPVYLFKAIEIHTAGKAENLNLPMPEKLGLRSGGAARSRDILSAQESLLKDIKNQGFPFPKIAERRVVVDHRERCVNVTFDVDPGPLGHFGTTTVEGLKSVKEQYVMDKVPWQKGEKFDASLLSKFHKRLVSTKLFSIVRIDYAKELDKNGLLPITVNLTERKHRSVGAGASWSSDEGFGGKVTWENRNLFQGGERLYLGLDASEIDLSAQARFEKPSFLRKNQTLNANFDVAYETTDAYDSRNVGSSIIVNREIKERMILGAGGGFRSSKVKQIGTTESFQLVYLPAHFDWDETNDLLDPTRGGRFNIQLAPYYDLAKSDLGFVKGQIIYSHYIQLIESPFLLFAGRVAMGSIGGASFGDIPADLRFYAGGGGSIRGYAYQTVGPLLGKDPIGGRSLAVFSAEFRFKATETLGFVAFLDGGSAFETTYPSFDETLRWGAGPGFRYYTPIGPLRLDVGFPINKRPGIDSDYQIYVSIGQAF